MLHAVHLVAVSAVLHAVHLVAVSAVLHAVHLAAVSAVLHAVHLVAVSVVLHAVHLVAVSAVLQAVYVVAVSVVLHAMPILYTILIRKIEENKYTNTRKKVYLYKEYLILYVYILKIKLSKLYIPTKIKVTPHVEKISMFTRQISET